MRKETEYKIYKANVFPTMTYVLETKARTWKTRQILETNEMKIPRKIVGKTKRDRIRSKQFRESCGIQPVNEWMERRMRERDEHVTRMDAERLVKISRDNVPAGRRSPGRLNEDKVT